MGYRSYYTLTAEDAEGRPMTGADPALPDAVKSISGYTEGDWWRTGGAAMISEEIKWYDHEEHLAEISKAFPAYRFTLFVEGEDGARAYLYALAGTVERCPGVMTFADRSIW